ncbi:MAG: universal stress protein, partial [Dehalococcoidia bacterium]
GSTLAEQVLPYVRLIASRLSLPVELLQIVAPGPQELAPTNYSRHWSQRLATLTRQSEEYLEKVAKSLRDRQLTVSSSLRSGNPAEEIARAAGGNPDTLIAMSTHGWSGVARWFLGSVTNKVLRATTNPLLIVRTQPPEQGKIEARFQTVVVPLDGSRLSEQVLPQVVPLATAMDLRIVLVRVTPCSGEYHRYMEYISAPYGDLSSGVNEQAVDYLHRVGQELRRQGVSDVQERVLHGHPAVAIVDFARAVPYNLIAMTSHGRSGVGYWLLGSVTDLVARHSGDPVLVVQATERPRL